MERAHWEQYLPERGPREWDEQLVRLDGYNFFQGYEWAEHKGGSGWKPLRLLRRDTSGEVLAMAQCLIREYFSKVSVVWIPGGPVGRLTEWSTSLHTGLRGTCRTPYFYCRFNSVRDQGALDVSTLAQAGWQQARFRLGSRQAMYLDIEKDAEQNLARLSRNWRRNLNRAGKRHLRVEHWTAPDADAVLRLYTEMEEYKGFEAEQSRDELRSMLCRFGDSLIIYRCLDEDGAVLAMRGCGVLGDKAWDLLAATSVGGRKVYASYAVFWALLHHCRRLRVDRYDLSGVDPEGNPGVYNFKKGCGSVLIKYLGEWEFAFPKALSYVAEFRLGLFRYWPGKR